MNQRISDICDGVRRIHPPGLFSEGVIHLTDVRCGIRDLVRNTTDGEKQSQPVGSTQVIETLARDHLAIHHKIVVRQSLQGGLRQDDGRVDARRAATRVGLHIPVDGRVQTVLPFLRLLPPLREQRKQEFSLTRLERVEPRIWRVADAWGSKGLPSRRACSIESHPTYRRTLPTLDEREEVVKEMALLAGIFP
ncbi:MAG: hypothetical protein IPJ73_13900 [Zoogloea sp.]|nr:hypothetical protein [Zoogloea sp.]